MLRLHSLVSSAMVSSFFLLAACGGGADGASSLSALAPEPAGTACPHGGMRLSTGSDRDGNGTLDPSEATSTEVVCNGAPGKEGASTMGADAGGTKPATLAAVSVEPKGVKCTEGGVRIDQGLDANASGALDASEITSSQFVCNGASGKSASGAVATAYEPAAVNVAQGAGSATTQELAITAPGPGKVLAFASADVYCALPAIGAGHDCATNGITAGFYTLTTDAAATASSGTYDFFHLTPNATEASTRTAVFDVAAAGEVKVRVRASASTGQIGFFRRQLTLVFVPN